MDVLFQSQHRFPIRARFQTAVTGRLTVWLDGSSRPTHSNKFKYPDLCRGLQLPSNGTPASHVLWFISNICLLFLEVNIELQFGFRCRALNCRGIDKHKICGFTAGKPWPSFDLNSVACEVYCN